MRREYDFRKARRGPVVAPEPGKTRITIRLDNDILDWFREQANAAGGGNYQTMINDALRQFMKGKREPIEKVLRRVIRQELKRCGAAQRHAVNPRRPAGTTVQADDTTMRVFVGSTRRVSRL